MKRKLLFASFIFILLLIVGFADPYASRIRPFAAVPGTCAENNIGYSMTLHNLYICTNAGYKIVDISGATTYAPIGATYITQIADANLTNEQALSALATGILKNTTTTGVLSIAAAGTDYQVPITLGDVTTSGATSTIGATKVTNAMLAGSIAYSKLSLTGAILNADLAGSIAYSKLSLTGAILNADLAGSIAASKLVGTDITTIGTITSIPIFSPTARSSGAAAYFTINIPADTAQTLSTESPGFKIVSAIRQWATGALTLQRENLFNGPTISFVGASTLTDGFTVGITPVVQGTNATITRIHSLGILDPTSASSSITGGLVVATTFGTSVTSVGIGGGNINAGGSLTLGGGISAGSGNANFLNTSVSASGQFYWTGRGVIQSHADSKFKFGNNGATTGVALDTSTDGVLKVRNFADSGDANIFVGALTTTGIITPSQTSGIVGTTTNNSANAGSVGEYIEGTLASGSATSLTTATAKTITSISLTAGDWDVTAISYFNPAASTTVTDTTISISSTNNTLDSTLGKRKDTGYPTGTVFGGNAISIDVPSARLSLSGTTTIYLVAYSDFGVSTMTGYGIIHARRVR